MRHVVSDLSEKKLHGKREWWMPDYNVPVLDVIP